jgi:type IV pilus assembly protein PilB
MQPARLRLGQLLVDAHIVSAEQLEQVLAMQKTDGRRLGTLLVESGLVTETQLTQILSQQLSVPWVSLYHIDFSRELLNLVPRDIAEKYCLVPIYIRPVRGQGDTLYVAMDDPMNEDALRECAASAGLPARPMIAAPSAILKAIRLYYGGAVSMPAPAGATPRAAVAQARAAAAAFADAPTAQPPAVSTAALTPATARSRAEAISGPQTTPSAAAALAGTPRAELETLDNTNGSEGVAMGAVQAAAAPAVAAKVDEDGPSLEVREIELPRNARKRAQLKLTLLDGTTIKMPTDGRKRRGEAEPPSAPSSDQDITAADLLSALRAAAHGADPGEVLGAELRWERMMAAVLALLMRKHLILDRELIEELKKI